MRHGSASNPPCGWLPDSRVSSAHQCGSLLPKNNWTMLARQPFSSHLPPSRFWRPCDFRKGRGALRRVVPFSSRLIFVSGNFLYEGGGNTHLASVGIPSPCVTSCPSAVAPHLCILISIICLGTLDGARGRWLRRIFDGRRKKSKALSQRTPYSRERKRWGASGRERPRPPYLTLLCKNGKSYYLIKRRKNKSFGGEREKN